LTGTLASSIFGYRDVLFPHRTPDTAEDLRKLNCLHSLNHIFKTRDRVIKNNSRIPAENRDEDIEVRDQGFTRPKVLIILPTRQSCAKYIETIVALVEPEQQENKKRFHDSYVVEDDHFAENKPEDFKELFGGNDDDMFRIGLKFTRKTIKYFAQFYSSDIIFASPLGLRMALGLEGAKKKDYDFLSSIEVIIVDQAEALAMQNWEHMEYIFEHLNLQPKEAHGCDFSRVRNWYLDNNAKYLRQTILVSAFNFPSLNRLYTHHMLNIAGKVKYHKDHKGMMLDLGIQIKQRFSRYETGSTLTDPDDRFNYFTTALVPSLTKKAKESDERKQGVLIYLPLYADFVRVRNYLSTSPSAQSISFGSISEYTPIKDVARARSHFVTGRHSVLLYTERAHHFRRYHLKGVKTVIMYGLPENPLFYKEIAGGFLGSSISEAIIDSSSAYVRSLFSRLDVLKLERIVGTKRFSSLVKERSGDTFDFV
jgi:U3 small nucleolar RNA-associated protein 25